MDTGTFGARCGFGIRIKETLKDIRKPQWTYYTEVLLYPESDTENRIISK